MGNSPTAPLKRSVGASASGGMYFSLSYSALVDHALLLRQVIAHPEMTKEGETLNYFIKEYCYYMAANKMSTLVQQANLSWQLD